MEGFRVLEDGSSRVQENNSFRTTEGFEPVSLSGSLTINSFSSVNYDVNTFMEANLEAVSFAALNLVISQSLFVSLDNDDSFLNSGIVRNAKIGMSPFFESLERITEDDAQRITEEGQIRYTEDFLQNVSRGYSSISLRKIPFNSTMYIRENGEWVETLPYVRDKGSWGFPQRINMKIDGLWKRIW